MDALVDWQIELNSFFLVKGVGAETSTHHLNPPLPLLYLFVCVLSFVGFL